MVVKFDHRHGDAVEVRTVVGELVGYLCSECDEALPINYDCDDCMWVEVTAFTDAELSYVLGRPCHRHA